MNEPHLAKRCWNTFSSIPNTKISIRVFSHVQSSTTGIWHSLLGSFGSFPRVVREKQQQYQRACELRPDPFIRYEHPKLLDESRVSLAKVLNAPLPQWYVCPTLQRELILSFEISSGMRTERMRFFTSRMHNPVKRELFWPNLELLIARVPISLTTTLKFTQTWWDLERSVSLIQSKTRIS